MKRVYISFKGTALIAAFFCHVQFKAFIQYSRFFIYNTTSKPCPSRVGQPISFNICSKIESLHLLFK